MPVDLVLSSGFLAFARHAGFLAAVEDAGVEVDGVCGTSSGALCGALWAGGLPAQEVLARLTEQRPTAGFRAHGAIWRGAFQLGPLIDRLRELLPATFDALPRPFGVGVTTPGGGHRVLADGPLPEAVAASCAMPYVFAPVVLGGVPYRDGGAVQRLALPDWTERRGPVALLVHEIERSRGAASRPLPADVPVVRSPRSGARLWGLGDVASQFAETRAATGRALSRLSHGSAGPHREG